MNRSYRLVWNQTLQMMQVAPEIATSRSSVPGSATHCRTPRRSLPRAAHQAGQIALMLGLTCAFPSAWAAGCAASDASACGASGGAGYPARSGNGGAGNGQGGGSSELDANTVTVQVPGGAPGASGSGGSGAAGDAGGNASGGATGLALSSTNVSVNTNFGGTAGDVGADGTNFGGGGGGGGTGLYYGGTAATIGVNAVLSGGAGGAGGATSNGVVGNAGAGGGGGAGMISITTGTNITSNGLIQGGAGGAGGTGGFGGGGGGGGDGLVVFGVSSSVINLGTIGGGAGGDGGAGASGNGSSGNGGAGVNLLGAFSSLANVGTITGGSSNGGAAGAGVITHGSNYITNAGTIVGGVANGTRAAAIQFGGTGNTLTLLSGSTMVGDLVVEAGASAQINPAHQGLSLGNAVILTDAASVVSFNTSTAPLTLTGTISGSGGMTAMGGTLSTSAVHDYTGATTITSGTLALTGNGSIAASSGLVNNGRFDISGTAAGASLKALTGTGVIALGSQSLTVNSAAGAFSGVIGGAGGFTVAGGTQTLSGVNTYTGATAIGNGATLALAGNGSLAASSGVINNGTFDISGATAGASVTGLTGSGAVALGSRTLTISNAASAFGGSIGGTGGLTVGGGTQTLTGANTYTGATTISPGATLAINGAGSIAASRGITNQGTLDISGTAAGASATSLNGSGNVALGARTLTLTNAAGNFSGSIAGTGGLTLNGGTQVLAGANSYTGATTINSGTLAVTGSLSSASNVVLAGPGAALDVSGAGPQRVTALTGGAGTRLQLGTSTLTLDSPADSTFDGSLNGSGVFAKQGAGMLTLNGDSSGFAGLTRVDGGTLAVGDANHDAALLGGNVAVGAQGTLKGHGTIAGSLLNQGIVMPGGSVGTLSVGGNYTQASNATLSIEVNPLESSLLRVGGAATLDGGLSIVYAPGTYTARRYTLLSAANGVNGTFATVTSTTSAGADLSTLDQSVTYGANEVGLQLFTPDAPGPVIVAPTNTSIYTALGTAAIMRAQSVNATLLGRFVPSPQTQPAARGAWIEATGSSTRLHADDGQPGFKANQFGFLAGTDRPVGDYTVGLAGGYAHTSINEDETGSSGATDTVRLALYGGRDFGPVIVSATLGYGLDFLSQKRPFGASGTAQGDHIGHEISAATQAAVPMRVGSVTLTPAAGLRYAFFRGASFTESGASAQNLDVDSDTARSLQPYVMLKLDKTFGEGERAIDAQLRVGYARELMGTSRQVTVLSQDGTRFAAPGVALPRNYVTGGASIGFRPSKATSISLGYDALINTGHASAQAGYARFEYQF